MRLRRFPGREFSPNLIEELRSAGTGNDALMPRGRIMRVETLVSTPLMNLPRFLLASAYQN